MANRLGSLGTSSALLARTATTLTARAVAIQRRSLATKGMDRASSDNASKGQVLGHQEHDHDHSTCGHDHSHDHHHHSHNHGPSPSTLIRPTAAQTVAKGSRLSNQPSKVKSAGVRLTKPIIGVEYCENLVRKADYEGFLCSQFFPADQRSTQMALRAFNIELASIRESVSNIDIGRIRMQFWRDSLDKIFANEAPHHPVAQALAYAIQVQKHRGNSNGNNDVLLSKIWFKRLITEREQNLSDPQFMTMAQMESYAENTVGSLMYLQLESVGVRSVEADHAASHLAKAIGIATLLRAFRFHMSQDRIVLPAEITAKHNLSQEGLFRNPTITAALQDSTLEVATVAHDHLETARTFLPKLPAEALAIMMPSIPTESYLKRLEKADFNPLQPRIEERDWFLPATLWSRWRKGSVL